ncbi:MAG: tyrosinase family protein [Nitrospira sp.]|nr:tyrosinase family protein [Nitrospira sp.]
MSNLDDRMWATMPSRRSFLQRMGLGVGALGAGLFGGLALPESVLAVCEPPGNPGTPKPWRKDCRMILPRRPASTLSAAEITQLKDAYKAMRALDSSAPNDPRGFLRQANVHCWYCGVGTQVHFTWQFFAWHRAYLYFHERMLGKLIGDMNFRLPYWDWDTPSHRKLPGAYTDPNDNSNPLWNGTRSMDPTEEIPEEDVGEDVMEAALTADTFTEFGGTASGSGIPEGTPHGAVHVDVGGDMGFFDSAGKDPVFYAHHANVDKMWSDWNKASSIHTNPTATAFLNLTWNFYDENKVWRSIKASQVLNHDTQLRYTYGPSKFLEQLPCLLDWFPIKTDWRVSQTLKFAGQTRAKMMKVVEQGGRARLHLNDLAVPTEKSAVYRLYATPEAAKTDEGPGSKGYLGTVPVVLNDRERRHVSKNARNIVVRLSTAKLEALSGSVGPVRLALVERGTKPEARKVIPVRAKDVLLSVAEVEREER